MNTGLDLAVMALEKASHHIEEVAQTLKEEGYPNIPCKCQRDFKLWLTIAEWNGWCLQKNGLTDHCRILDPDDTRRAWGTKKAMFDTLEQISKVKQGKKDCK